MSAKKQNKKKNPKGSRVTQRKHASHSPKSKASLGKVASKQKKRAIERTKPTLWEFTLHILYRQFYFLGITLLRRRLRYTRRLKRGFTRLRGRAYSIFEHVLSVFLLLFQRFTKRIKTPFQRIRDINAEVGPLIEAERARGRTPLSLYWRITASVLRLFSSIIITIVNYVAPILAAVLLVHVIQMYVNQPLALEVEYNGEVIGYVKTESEFEQAAQTLRDRFIDGSTTVDMPYFRLVAVMPDSYKDEDRYTGTFLQNLLFLERKDVDYTTADELADKMVQAAGDSIEWAYGFYVNNQFFGAVTERGYITNELEKIRAANSTGAPDERVDFVKRIGVREGLYPLESIIPTDSMGELIRSNETVDEIYIVEDNDTPTGIAAKNGIPYSQLLEYNPDIEDNLSVGQEVYLAVARPFISVKNIYTAVYEEVYPYEVELVESATYSTSYRMVLEEGEDGTREVTAEITTINGIETDRVIRSTKTLQEPKPEKVMVGTTDPQQLADQMKDDSGASAASTSGFMWPTVGGYINGGIGSYAGHTGIDIPRPAGTAIYASRGGTVVKAERTWVNYGHYVIIDHGDGYQTLYAHASEILVSVGQQVSQGDVVARVGRTGRATGNHLHFEVRYQGRIQIPQNYIGYGP